MMSSFFQFWKTIFCWCCMPLRFDSGSSSATTNQTYNYDQRQVNTTTTTLDGGSIGLAKEVALAAIDNTAHAYDYSENIFSAAVDFANQNDTRAYNAFDRAALITHDALTGLKDAYADAKGTTDSQKSIIYAVLGVAAVMAFTLMRARG